MTAVADRSKIEWLAGGATWNPVTGCSKVSPACAHCYAERMARRLAGRCGYPADESFRVTLHPERLEEPLRWRKPRRVFVVSMGDLFHQNVPDEYIDRVFSVMWQAEQHTFLLLTKRPWRMREYISSRPRDSMKSDRVRIKDELGWRNYSVPWPLPNVWLGVTAEDQQRADERIPILLQTPAAAVRWVSCEPLLGPIQGVGDTARIDWVVAGGETGPGARPMHPEWARSLRDQCRAARTAFFFKSWGDWLPTNQDPQHIHRRERFRTSLASDDRSGDVGTWHYVGKRRAGRLLDGRTWDQVPDR